MLISLCLGESNVGFKDQVNIILLRVKHEVSFKYNIEY